MLTDTDDAAVQADAYIDALLTGHRRLPVSLPMSEGALAGPLVRQAGMRDAIRLLEKGLPRFHPSFLFEEWLADQLRRKAEGGHDAQSSGQVVPIAVIRRSAEQAVRLPDRRLLVGGAICSGVSIAGAAMIAWRRSRN